MARFDPGSLERKSDTELLRQFWQAIRLVKDDTESSAFLCDLLHPQEVVMLARRIQIGKMLREGFNYAKIALLLRIAPNTIVKINRNLDHGRGGLATILDRLLVASSQSNPAKRFSWDYVKRTYAIHFWPSSQMDKLEAQWRTLEQSRRSHTKSTAQSVA